MSKAQQCDWRVEHGDFRDALASLTDVDALIVDPPYENAATPLYAELATWAKRVLKPATGVLAVMVRAHGEEYRTRLNAMAEHLPFRTHLVWLGYGAGLSRHWPTKTQSFAKLILVFGAAPRHIVGDLVWSAGKDKRWHSWGQDVLSFRQIVEKLTVPGDLVVDPMCGGGTTGVAAVSLGRRFVGADLDPEAVRITRERLGHPFFGEEDEDAVRAWEHCPDEDEDSPPSGEEAAF